MEYQKCITDLGLRILPLNGKKPLSHWKEEASLDLVPTASYGIVCDKIAVADTDTREKAIWWYRNRIRTAVMIRTPGGGVHFYYAGSPDLPNGQYDKWDLRAGGNGYVVGPGSVIKGKVYALIGEILS
ncbi:unnamed protein product [marine sediment metagenome]|uniref:DNA primase/polymerase bifunctional N-terminal domain-containing protein n=1 Tax=marine sediment metagenome TaxID=412755 RepID=X0U2V4_9ZZZZ